MDHFSKAPSADLSATDRLSERQKQCLELVADGYTSKQIARQLNLSPSTVDNHLNAALERLGADNRIQAARIFIEGSQHDKANLGNLLKEEMSEFIGPSPSNGEAPFVASLLSIPPIGGKKNVLSPRRRYYHVIQIMVLALMAFSAAIVTIAGIVHLFSK